jgi:hypothetical protein
MPKSLLPPLLARPVRVAAFQTRPALAGREEAVLEDWPAPLVRQRRAIPPPGQTLRGTLQTTKKPEQSMLSRQTLPTQARLTLFSTTPAWIPLMQVSKLPVPDRTARAPPTLPTLRRVERSIRAKASQRLVAVSQPTRFNIARFRPGKVLPQS